MTLAPRSLLCTIISADAAAAVLNAADLDYNPENPLEEFAWELGKTFTYELGLRELIAHAVTMDRRARHSWLALDLASENMTALFAVVPTYRKKNIVTARSSQPGESLATLLADGTIETSRTLTTEHIIVTNPGGEEYAVRPSTFAQRFEPLPDGTFRATGKVKSIPNITGRAVQTVFPWDEAQFGIENCHFVAVITEDGTVSPTDRYLIGHEEFLKTYELDD